MRARVTIRSGGHVVEFTLRVLYDGFMFRFEEVGGDLGRFRLAVLMPSWVYSITVDVGVMPLSPGDEVIVDGEEYRVAFVEGIPIFKDALTGKILTGYVFYLKSLE